jgi:plastocyanin
VLTAAPKRKDKTIMLDARGAPWRLRPLIVAVLAFAAACGGSDDAYGTFGQGAPTNSPTPTQTASPTADGTGGGQRTEVSLVAENNEFDLDSISVPVGTTVSLTLHNNDLVAHNFSVYQTPRAQESLFSGEIFMGPDASMTHEFNAPDEGGTYYFRCDVHPKIMTGDLIVE